MTLVNGQEANDERPKEAIRDTKEPGQPEKGDTHLYAKLLILLGRAKNTSERSTWNIGIVRTAVKLGVTLSARSISFSGP